MCAPSLRYVGAETEDLVFVENASEGMNAILQSLLVPGSGLLYLDLAYGMVQETIKFIDETLQGSEGSKGGGVSLAEVSTDDLFPAPSAEDFNAG